MNFQLESSVKNIMSTELYLLNIQDPISLVRKMFEKTGLRHLPVVSNHKAVGMVDINDLHLAYINVLEPELKSPNLELRVKDFMHRDPQCIDENQTIKEVADLFTSGIAHALPVMNYEGVVGIITTTDIIKFLMSKCLSTSNEKETASSRLSSKSI